VFDAGGDALIPFTAAAVPEVSVVGGYMVVDPIAAGLVDNEDGPDEDVADGPRQEGLDPKSRPRGPREAGGNR
ncbi:16S rRNA processing protein RimM, partial [Rhizobiaceae sp. 2RAB30]